MKTPKVKALLILTFLNVSIISTAFSQSVIEGPDGRGCTDKWPKKELPDNTHENNYLFTSIGLGEVPSNDLRLPAINSFSNEEEVFSLACHTEPDGWYCDYCGKMHSCFDLEYGCLQDVCIRFYNEQYHFRNCKPCKPQYNPWGFQN